MHARDFTWIALATLGLIIGIYSSTFFMNRPNYNPPSTSNVSSGAVIVHATVRNLSDNDVKVIDLPFSVAGAPDESLQFTIALLLKESQSTKFRVIPDDCIDEFNVNGQKVIQDEASYANRCNWQTGFIVDLKPYLHLGYNNVYIEIHNKEGLMGLQFTPVIN